MSTPSLPVFDHPGPQSSKLVIAPGGPFRCAFSHHGRRKHQRCHGCRRVEQPAPR